MARRALIIAIAAAAVLVLARSAIFLWWEQAGFESDQAIFGLMAKHMAEGRAFPVYIYGQRYLLAVQAWLAAPLFVIFEPSVPVLKLPLVVLNMATAGVLLWILHRDAGLRPALALLVSLFFVLAPPGLAAMLVETGGGNPEPFLYVLLLWLLRDRPVVFGAMLGFGFINREFTAYAATAIVALALLESRRLTAERMRTIVLATLGYLLAWQVIRAAFVFSSPYGPGSTIAESLGAGANLAGLASRFCWAPEQIVPGLATLFGSYFGVPFGVDDHRLTEFGIRSALRTRFAGWPTLWPLLALVFAFALGRVAWLSARSGNPVWRGRGAVGLFLLLVGLQAGVVYAVARCGQLGVGTFRYAILMLYAGVGVMTVFFVYETHSVWRRVMVAAMIAWAVMSGAAHVQLLDEYLNRTPAHPRRELATYLIDHGIRYARSDYWTAYATTFLANEKVIVASNDFVRISGYQTAVDDHSREAVIIQSQECRAAGGTEVVPDIYWVCPQ